MNAAQLINQTSGGVEYYTPPAIIEAARRTMGGIDLDPASSSTANRIVKARRIFTNADDGLSQRWDGRVWMNHPFGRSTNRLWITKLVEEFCAGNIDQACCITFASTSEGWFAPLFEFVLCFLSPRTNYLLPDGSVRRGVTKGSVCAYLGANEAEFVRQFRHMGHLTFPAPLSGAGTEKSRKRVQAASKLTVN